MQKPGLKSPLTFKVGVQTQMPLTFFNPFEVRVFDLLQKRYVNIVSIHEICLSFKLCKIISLL
jgi:hypothetical protein